MKHFAYCPYGVQWFKNNGLWHASNPQRGDVIFFWDSGHNEAAHTGLVSSAGNGKVVTIEGNTSSQSGVIANGGAVAKKSYAVSYNRIMGYGRPSYEKYETQEVEDDDMITQEQFNQMMDAYLENLAKKEPDAWSQEHRDWAESAGLIKGDENGDKQYKSFCTRE